MQGPLGRTLRHWQARMAVMLGQTEMALSVWDRLIEDFGPTPQWLGCRAHLLAQLGRTAPALRDYAWLCGQPLAQACDWFNRGFLLEQTGQHQQACECFETAVKLDPQLDRAWYGLGLCRVRLGQLEQAFDALTRNTQLQPMSPHGWVQLARIHEQRQEPEKVQKIILHLQGFEPKVAAELMRETGISLKTGRA